jgi:hypothetical protein
MGDMGDVESEVMVIGSSSIIETPLVPKGPRSEATIVGIGLKELVSIVGGVDLAAISSIAGVTAFGFNCHPLFMS